MNELIRKRMDICKECHLYRETKDGPVCNSKRYMSPNWKDWSYFPKDGWIKGCGCNLDHRTRQLNNHCVAGKW